ncbi:MULTISPECIES: hypothetical protein [unclassified Leptotrichia]|jgi:hypothetical protein|uniref:hypothetical protein n=1 Tax=unclassified Leptotrichia TaxID=2633022 RepID=UPI00182E76A0|nr:MULTISPECIES: hypothetical protein [unclassified Leptotrichia]MBB1535103.1 hypothetical protein [Leptotrichia sp.]QUB97880.1 hypothetical protein J4863_04030 [Leptotrichia sp. oral taxon 221]
MGFRLTVKGQNEEILLDKESILDVKYMSETPDDSNARATDLGVILEIKGKILAAANGDTEDDTRKVAQWSLVPSESSDAYRQASLEVISAGQMVRKIDMTNVFVVDYIEEYGSQAGTGTFSLKIKQKKEKVIEVAIEGGYAAQEEA